MSNRNKLSFGYFERQKGAYVKAIVR